MTNSNKGMTPASNPGEDDDLVPSFDLPSAMPVVGPAFDDVPLALPASAVDEVLAAEPILEAEPVPAPVVKVMPPCPICGAARAPKQVFCHDCGFHLNSEEEPMEAGAVNTGNSVPANGSSRLNLRVKQRYELTEQLSERLGVVRYRGRDLGLDGTDNVPVIVLKQEAEEVQAAEVAPEEAPAAADEEILPSFDFAPAAGPVTAILPANAAWPGTVWEREMLDTLENPGLPVVLDTFQEDGFEYVVEEYPQGRSLWDAWDDPDADHSVRFNLLIKVAETMQALHRYGVIIEGVRPDIINVNEQGQPRFWDLSDFLPVPVPADAPIRGTLYTAPELLATPATTDARADLYSFGAMLLALNLGHELTERQFLKPGNPKPIFNDYPDMHPGLGRLMMKTFCRQVEGRFPSDEAVKDDKTGFTELIKTLKVLARTMDQCRLEIAAWTTTGMVRTGNEDAFAFLHACESRQDDVADSALILLADGMGGYDAGEVAAAMALSQLRKNLAVLKPISATAGATGFPSEYPQAESNAPLPLDVEETKRMLKAALKDANKHVFTMSRTPGGPGRRGMGCTAEAVYVDGRNLVVGHVGDSRVYHLSEGNLIQVTRDQTLVNRLVELGTLSPEEAEDHPRKNELQQAIGGQPDVEPGIYHARLKPGDFVVVCSDGLSNHIKDAMLRQFLRGEAVSAEQAARRLVNLVNIEGATDNATVVVVRAT